MKFKDYLMSIELTETDKTKFVGDCASWERFIVAIKTYDKPTTLKLLKYFTAERQSARRMIARTVDRFNTLNKLRKEDLK